MAIRVQTNGAPGASADLTDKVIGLQWSSVNPGGDEQCSFQLKRQWFAGAPEIAQGNLLRITDGLTMLWMGRIEENDRAVSDSEYIGVTAYGLGTRLKDALMTEVYVDRDASAWTGDPFNEQARDAAAAVDFGSFSWTQEAGGLVCALPSVSLTACRAGIWYTAPNGALVAKVEYIGADTSLPAGWEAPTLRICASDSLGGVADATTATFDSTLRSITAGTARRYAMWKMDALAVAALTPAKGASRRISAIAVYGNHGLTTRTIDAATPDGLYVEDIVNNAVSKASGITVQRLDTTSVILPHFTVKEPTTVEDVITQANTYAGYDWGTFGPPSPLDTSTNGYFYFQARDTATAHWYARRSDCDDIALQVEMASLYNQVTVTYTDPTTTGLQTVTRTATVQTLSDAGITRTARLDAGVMTLAGAQQLGDIFLALTSQQPPARGTIKLSAAPTHYQRGRLPAHFMRADGSNIRVPDVLPSKDALSLSAAPDRRTTFPIKRVTVDCSGGAPVVSVDVDQTPDELSALQARLGLAAQYPTAALPAGVTF